MLATNRLRLTYSVVRGPDGARDYLRLRGAGRVHGDHAARNLPRQRNIPRRLLRTLLTQHVGRRLLCNRLRRLLDGVGRGRHAWTDHLETQHSVCHRVCVQCVKGALAPKLVEIQVLRHGFPKNFSHCENAKHIFR